MSTATSLFVVVKAIVHNAGIVLPHDEKAFVQMLHAGVSEHPTLATLYKNTLTRNSTQFVEAYLPLLGRMVKNTVGLLDDQRNVVHIPHQWFTTDHDEYPEVILKTIHNTTQKASYAIDFDEEYIERYSQLATQHDWSITTDALCIPFGVDKNNEQHTPSSVPTHFASIESLEEMVEATRVVIQRGTNYEQAFLDTWANHYHFDAEVIPKTTAYPNPLLPNFHNELYKTSSFAFARIVATDDTVIEGISGFSFKDHQKYVRNFISPLTPYNSLLIVHSTGSGKTFTTYGITEQFRAITYIQNKQIHITCPRREICDEFRNYLKSGNAPHTPQHYVYTEYEKNSRRSSPFYNEKHTQQYANSHYNIATYYSIFPRQYYEYVHTLQTVFCAWQVVLPSITSIRRTENGFLLISHAVKKQHHATLRSSFQKITDMHANALGERWDYLFEPTKDEMRICVTNIKRLMQFEKHLVHTYANTVFVVDEAHRVNKDDGATQQASDETAHNTQSINWTFMLSFVISVLRYHHCRMRLLMLTATPMQNESQDMIRLLNLMILNDGYKQESPHKLYKKRKITQLSQSEQERLALSIAARVSYFKDDRGKPIKLVADDLFYNIPRGAFAVVPHFGAVCPVLCVSKVEPFLSALHKWQTPSLVWDQRKATARAHAIPLTPLRASAKQSTQTYVFVVLHPPTNKSNYDKWVQLCGKHLNNSHTVVLLTSSKDYARTCSNNPLYKQLYAHTSIRRPFVLSTDAVRSRYATTTPPTIYAKSLGNLKEFFNTYYPHSPFTRASNTNFNHTPSIVVTPMQNRAFTTQDNTLSLRYNFVGQRLNNWNVRDTTDRVYQPKIDTMMALMETLPGNILIYTNEVQLGQGGARSLLFLKRLIEQRFRKRKQSRLCNVKVEILHKETLAYKDDTDFANALNKRIQEINTTLLAKRNDVVLIGSTEIREGLTMDEVRQVHMLDVSWNIAQMQQITGRAIRINNHRKYKHEALHNVACFLHITVPESVVHEETPPRTLGHKQNKKRQLSRMSYLERVVGDLHRFKCMHEKIDDIVQATSLLQLNALDIVFLNMHSQQQLSVLSDDDSGKNDGGWLVRKLKTPSARLLQVIHTKKVKLITVEKTNSVMHTEPKEIMRKEIDLLKREIAVLFQHNRVPYLTYSELNRHLVSFGQFKQPSAIAAPFCIRLYQPYYKHIAEIYTKRSIDTHNILRIIPLSKDFPLAVKNQLLLNILCCQYQWFVNEETDDYYIIQVDPQSIVCNPEWLWTSEKAPTVANPTLRDLRTASTPDCKKTLDTLSRKYAVLKHNSMHYQDTQPSPSNLPKGTHHLHGITCLQHISNDALDCAIYELIHDRTPIEHTPRCFYCLVYLKPFYTLQRLNVPPTLCQWNNVSRTEFAFQHTFTEEPVPYSLPLMKHAQFSVEVIGDVVTEMGNTRSALADALVPLCTHVATATLKQYLAEYLFDHLSLALQDALLRTVCTYGFAGLQQSCKLHAEHIACFETCIYHRYCEKGRKVTECTPEHAQYLLKSWFANCAGRLYCSLPLNPATEPCTVSAYSSLSSTGKDCLVKYQPHATSLKGTKHEHLQHETISYFSPIPVSKTNDNMHFFSSTRVHHASTPPLHKTTPFFGYNEVLNYKNKDSSFFKRFLCTADQHTGLELTTPEALRALDAHYHTQPSTSLFGQSVEDTERRLAPTVEAQETHTVRLDTKSLCRFLYLRHLGVYQRYFYSGIVTKHPNREYYADYKHNHKRKKIL